MRNNNFVQKGTFYQLIVGTFADSNGDGIGDIQGLINKLDYLNDGKGGGLGVSGIWLCPIHPSYTYHKYDINDYFGVDKDYGNVDSIVKLVAEAKKRGIAVILDLVFNCVASTNPIFIEAAHNVKSKYRDYFYFHNDVKDKGYDLSSTWNTLPSWQSVQTAHGEEKYIGIYHAIMPDLNFYNKEVREYCKSVATFWLDKGVAGFRLDSAMHLFSASEVTNNDDYHALNVKWWTEFYNHCRSIKNDVYLVGEVWDEKEVRAQYMQGLKSDFQFYLGEYLGETLEKNTDKAFWFKDYLFSQYDEFRKVNGMDYINAPFLSNHDESRYLGNCVHSKENALMAANVCLTIEGLPFIYYGEELGFVKPNDNVAKTTFEWFENDSYMQSRTAFLWGKDDSAQTNYIYFDDEKLKTKTVVEQENEQGSFLNHYKRLIKIRNKFAALNEGRIARFDIASENILSYEMKSQKDSVILVHNLSKERQKISIKDKTKFINLNTGEEQSIAKELVLPAKTSYLCF